MNSTFTIFLGYLAIIFFIAWYFSRNESIEAYFSNNKQTKLWMMTFSHVSSIVGAGATVAIVSEVYNSGISYGIALPISFVVGMIILGITAKKIKQIGDKYKCDTMVDFYRKRFDKKNEILMSILQVLLLIIWIGTQAVALASLTSVLLSINYGLALLIVGLFTIIYTSIGGLKVDIITDFIQFWIIFGVFSIMGVLGYLKVGSFSNLVSNLPITHFNLFAFGGVSWFVGAVLLSGFLYLGNTSNWQRLLSAQNEKIARRSFFLSIPFVLILSLIILFLGLVAKVVLVNVVKEQAIFTLMETLLPTGFTGIGFAAILAVIMSSIDSLLVGGSTIIYKIKFKHKKNGINIARFTTLLFGVFSFGIAYLIPDIMILSMLTIYFALIFIPSIFAGLYSKKITSNAVFYSLLIPSIILALVYPILTKHSFLISTPLSIFIILFYDKILHIFS